MLYNQKFSISAIAIAAIFSCGSAMALDCTKASGAMAKSASSDASVVLLPGGTAEYSANGKCTVLTFTGMKDGKIFYTDDGLGRGLGVLVTLSSFEAITPTGPSK